MTRTILIDQVTFRPEPNHPMPSIKALTKFCGTYPARNLAEHLKLRISFKLVYRPKGGKNNVDLLATVTGKKDAVLQFQKARQIHRN